MNEEIKTPNNSEIDQALKEFEAKSVAEKVPNIPEVSKDSEMPKMVRWVIKISGGTIKEQKTAEYVLLGLVIIMFAVSFYLFFGGGVATKQKIPVAVLEQMKLMPPPPAK